MTLAVNRRPVIQVADDGLPVVGPLTNSELRASVIGTSNAALDAFAAELREHVTAAARTITSDHASIHLGWGFSFYVTFDSVADAQSRNVVMVAPPVSSERPYVHLKFYDTWINNAAGIMRIYENPFAVVGGTPILPVNRNRISDIGSELSLVHTATVTLNNSEPAHTATLLETLRFGGGGTGPQGRSGGDRSIDIEWVLKPAETYVFQITNQSGAAADIGFWAFWYEEPAHA